MPTFAVGERIVTRDVSFFVFVASLALYLAWPDGDCESVDFRTYFRNLFRALEFIANSRLKRGDVAVLPASWKHHSRHSGILPIAKETGIFINQGSRVLPRSISRWLTNHGSDVTIVDVAQQLILQMRLAGRTTLLVLDGDHSIPLLHQLRKRSNLRLFAMFHQPPGFIEEVTQKYRNPFLHGAICVARCQMGCIAPFVEGSNVTFIPHGVDTEYFFPRSIPANSTTVLTVGVHRRDFRVLSDVAERIRRTRRDVKVKLVAPSSHLPKDIPLENFELALDISDEQLRSAYQDARVLLMPLIAATANNSILEAIASGVPVVATDVGGVRDYLDEEFATLCEPRNACMHALAVCEFLENDTAWLKASSAARHRAMELSWPRVRTQLHNFIRLEDVG